MIRSARLFAGVCATLAATSCADRSSDTENEVSTVVLYTSADDTFAGSVVEAFERDTGVRVELVGDTEATKTTGLVTRLLAEREAPRADVWWSSEPMGTIQLAGAGVLEPGGMAEFAGPDWPSELVGESGAWIGFAERARVIAYSVDRVPDPPTTLAELTDTDWSGRVGIARPQFGTTRGHMGLLESRWGSRAFEAWLIAMRDNGVRIYDGNARVVRAIFEGEIDIALTDTDDVWVAIDNGWPIGMVYETRGYHPLWPSPGPTTIPNTVGIVAGGPNPDAARELARYLVSPAVERLLAESTSRNIPVHPELRDEFSELVPDAQDDARPDYRPISESVSDAIDACDRLLISP